MECKICNKNVNGTKGLSIHLNMRHKDISIKDYYDKYLKKEDEGNCYFCGNPSIFFNLTKGYHKICESKECLGKTRATGTYEFLMYKYNLKKEDAIKLKNERALERGGKIKNGLWKSFEKNENFFKEKSIQSEQYWIKRGYNEDEAKEKSIKVQKNIVEKTLKKRHDNKHLYLDVNTTQIAYWVKRGYNEEESKLKVSERQKTFNLDKCIKKYGETEGLRIWNERQMKWKKSLLENGNLKCGYSKISQELFYILLEKYDIDERGNIYFATKNQEYYISMKNNVFYQYDFTDRKNKKIIEYNGDVYHANPDFYKIGDTPHPFRKNETFEYLRDKDKNKVDAAEEKGFSILTIWDSEYRKDPEKVIQECIDFLKK